MLQKAQDARGQGPSPGSRAPTTGNGAHHDGVDEASPRAIISLRGISKTYVSGGEVTNVLKSIDLDIEAGSFNVIRGESGSGKTSLLRILGMLDTDFQGTYHFGDVEVRSQPDWYKDELRANNIGFIFQDGQLFAHLAIRENIVLPVRLQGTRDERKMARQRLQEIAPVFFRQEAELDQHILTKKPAKVSGGQKQRAAIMRSVLNRPAIILADEPTASLDEDRKKHILGILTSLCDEGHTVIVVSHDKVFHGVGRQLELEKGVLHDVGALPVANDVQLPIRPPAEGSSIAYGWKPRAPLPILITQALRETFLRPIFLFLVLISLCLGVCQIGVFTSIIIGAQTFLNDAMTKGSRLNRLEVKPRTADLSKEDRFPVLPKLKEWTTIENIVPRRATIARIIRESGDNTRYSAMGLHPDDPEYRLLTFVAGGPFSPSNEELEVIVTVALLPDLFNDSDKLASGELTYKDYIGRKVTIETPQFARTGQELAARAVRLKLSIAGIILFAEGGRQLYLPNKLQLVLDRYKMDRDGAITLPVNETGDGWSENRAQLAEIANFPWEDQLHVYTKEIRQIIPVFQDLSQLGYKPASDIWNYKWVLDLRDLAWNIFVPLLGLIILAVGLTVATNLYSSAKLREKEFALWRILGMRRGDLVFTQVVSTILMVLVGTALGLYAGDFLVTRAQEFLAAQNPGAGIEKVFASIVDFYPAIVVSAVVLGVLAGIYPAVRTARADPAKVLHA